MNNIDKRFLKAISQQATDNVPKLYIQDVVSGRVFEYGGNCHDRLIISEDGRCLTYYNLQNGDGSCVGDYRFYYEKPEDETDFDADEWARMVKHQSITELLAEKTRVAEGYSELFDKKQHENYEQFCEIAELKQSQNQTAIAVLEKLKKDFEFGNSVSGYGGWELSEITDYIDQQIKELKGEK